MDAESIVNVSLPVLPEPSPLSSRDAGLHSVATEIFEAPYRLPKGFGLARLQPIIAAKLSAAEDHHWVLREDPTYFLETIHERNEHLIMHVPAPGSTTSPDILKVVKACVADSIVLMEVWGFILDRIAALQALQEKYKDVIDPNKSLPDEYATQFYRLLSIILGRS